MTIKSNGGVFGRNPSFNNMFATSASVDALTVNGATSLRSNATISSLSGGTRLTIENPAANASNADIRFLASGTGDGVIGFSRAASGLFFNTGGSESARITFGGDLSLLKGNVIVTSGKGIDFSATAGTGTSELFNDYEEGTWTPVVSSTSGTITSYTINSARYTKIGRVISLSCQIAMTNNGTGAGSLFIQGFPFTNNAATCGVTYNQSTGLMGSVLIVTSGTDAFSVKYDGTYPIATGQTIQLALSYAE